MSETSISSFRLAELRQFLWSYFPLSPFYIYEGLVMIVTKVQKQSKKNKAIFSPPSAETETTTSGIRVPVEDISVCAFHLYQERGGEDGHDLQDWLKAELKITQR